MVSVEKPFMHSLFKEVLDGKNILKTRNHEHMKLILAPKLETITIYSSILKSVLFKKILEKPSGTQNLQKLPQLINAK